MKKIHIELVDDWKSAWKWFSVNCMAVSLAVQTTWAAIPEDMRSSLPPYLVSTITVFLLALGIAGRIIKQKKPTRSADDK